MFFKQFSTTHTKPSKKHFLQCNSLYTPLSMNKKWFISLPTQWRVVGNSVGISNGRYEPKLECPVGRRGSNKENPLWGWGGGCVDIFWISMFPILLCPRNGDSSPLNTIIGTVWTLLNKLNHDTTHVIQLTWYNSLWLWRWLLHRLSKRQSLSTTTVLFRTTFTQMIKLNLLKWLLGSNLSQTKQ